MDQEYLHSLSLIGRKYIFLIIQGNDEEDNIRQLIKDLADHFSTEEITELINNCNESLDRTIGTILTLPHINARYFRDNPIKAALLVEIVSRNFGTICAPDSSAAKVLVHAFGDSLVIFTRKSLALIGDKVLCDLENENITPEAILRFEIFFLLFQLCVPVIHYKHILNQEEIVESIEQRLDFYFLLQNSGAL